MAVTRIGIIVVTAIVAITQLFADNWEQAIPVILVGIVFLALAELIVLLQSRQGERVRSMVGLLSNSWKGLWGKTPDRMIRIGASDTLLRWAGSGGKVGIEVDDRTFIGIRSCGKKVLLSVPVRNAHGDIVAELVDNAWKVNPSASFDRNYTDRALEVLNSKGLVVLQVLVDDDYIQVSTRLYDSSGRLISLMGEKGQGGSIYKSPPLPESSVPLITRMFKYPSERHLGEYV